MTNQRQAPIPAQFNFNDFVKVRLTDCGQNVLAIKRKNSTRAPETDADGYTKFQLWELMNVFGEHLCNGCPVPFNPNIIFLAAYNPTMTNQHRATDEQWHWQTIKELLPENPRSPLPACILELRDRIQALEAAQHAHITGPSEAGIKAAELEWARTAPGMRYHYRMLALQDQIRDGALSLADALKEIDSAPETAADARQCTLVERVAHLITDLAPTSTLAADNRPAAIAVIREVAAWLRSESPLVSGNSAAWASLLERESNR
jgi:hypothetical protein